jgi:response regulator RpfG family c-di-GMP phosphodiesterase
MAHNLGLKVVAEGVETASQLSFLAAHDCDQIQGYYFAQALPEREMTAMLTQRRRLARPSGEPDNGDRTLLLVDDDATVLSALTGLLRQDDYRIFTATNAKAGFEILANHRVGVIISDQCMPEVTGTEFLRRVKQLYPGSVRMVLSADTELETVTEAINQGAIYRYLTKPWDANLLRAHIAEASREYVRLQKVELDRKAASARMRELTETNIALQTTLSAFQAAPQAPAEAPRSVHAIRA